MGSLSFLVALAIYGLGHQQQGEGEVERREEEVRQPLFVRHNPPFVAFPIAPLGRAAIMARMLVSARWQEKAEHSTASL